MLFWSYAHFDDEHENHDLAFLHERLTGELRMQIGMVIDSFWDERGIRLAEDWQERIHQELGNAALMVAIISPAYFQSAYCRAEYEYFRNREDEEGAGLRIIPVYYVTARELESPADAWAKDLARRRRFDWRKLRGKDRQSTPVKRGIQELATEIKPLLPDASRRALRVPTAGGGRARTPDEIDYAYLQQTSTQKHIVETLYRLPRRDIAVDDFFGHFCKVEPDAVTGTAEMFYRLKDLMHHGLLEMKRIGVKATIIKAAPEVGNVLFDRKRIDT